MNSSESKNHIKNILEKEMKFSEGGLPKAENASFNVYSKSWATSIAIDIRGYSKFEGEGNLEREEIIKILQAFTSTAIKVGKESNNFISAYTNGDEVILNFKSNKKSDNDELYDIAVRLNSIFNHQMNSLVTDIMIFEDFFVGIGIYLCQDNSLIKYGEKGSDTESFNTIIGKSIIGATTLAKFANKDAVNCIVYNNLFAHNLSKGISSHNKYAERISFTYENAEFKKALLAKDLSTDLWHTSVYYTAYKK